MGGVFSIVLAVSLLGSIVGLFAIVFRQSFKNIVGRSFIYILWLFVLIRCWTPINFESSLSIFNFMDLPSPIEYYNILGIIWGKGCLTLLSLFILMYAKIRHTMKDKILVKTVSKKLQVFESPSIDCPVIFWQ